MGENGAGGWKTRAIGAEIRVFGAETEVLAPSGAEMGENGAGGGKNRAIGAEKPEKSAGRKKQSNRRREVRKKRRGEPGAPKSLDRYRFVLVRTVGDEFPVFFALCFVALVLDQVS